MFSNVYIENDSINRNCRFSLYSAIDVPFEVTLDINQFCDVDFHIPISTHKKVYSIKHDSSPYKIAIYNLTIKDFHFFLLCFPFSLKMYSLFKCK